MISVVNGYVCNSSCDAAAAKQGKDPSAPPGSPPGASGKTDKTDKTDKTSGFDRQPVIILDGALKASAGTDPVTPASNAAPANDAQSPPQSVNILA